MKYILLAVVLIGIATTSLHAQLFAVGPDGFRVGKPMDRHYGHYMRRDGDRDWVREHRRYRHPPRMIHRDYDDDEE